MAEGGLQAVPNPSASFLGDRAMGANAHACVTVMLEGTRPLLLEVQALCSPVHHQARGGCPPPRPASQRRQFPACQRRVPSSVRPLGIPPFACHGSCAPNGL